MPWKASDWDHVTETQWAYLAGLVDGEGCLGVYARSKRHLGPRQLTPAWSYRPRIIISNTSEAVIEWLTMLLGGKRRTKPQVKGCKTSYVWFVNDVQAIFELCRRMLPYLVIKTAQARLILEFPWGVQCNQYTTQLTTETWNVKRELYERTLALNKRGA